MQSLLRDVFVARRQFEVRVARATKMICASAAELENKFLAMLPAVTTYQVSDTVLTLSSKSGLVARFHVAR